MTPKHLLAVYAHPDDEMGVAGLFAMMKRRGDEVTLICATRGEVGEISDPALATPETLGQVREGELVNAMAVLGVTNVEFLNYRDSGMAGTEDNNNPKAFMNADANEVIGQLVTRIRAIKPDAIITFEPYGGYGHPDHQTISKHTIAAFHAAADPAQFPGTGEPWQTLRLWYGVWPRSAFQKMREWMQENAPDDNIFKSLDPEQAGWPDDQVHASIPVAEFQTLRNEAMAKHATQQQPNSPWEKIPEDVVASFWGDETLSLAWPDRKPTTRLTDIFDEY